MKTYQSLLMATAAVALTASGVMAQTATQNVDITATVAPFCTIGGAAIGATNLTADLNSKITNGQVSDTSAVTATGTIGTIVCNSATKLTLKTTNGGATTLGAASSGFTNRLDYTAKANVGGASEVTLDTTAQIAGYTTAAGPANGGATTAGTLTVTVAANSTGANYLVPGTYTDLLVVSLIPQ